MALRFTFTLALMVELGYFKSIVVIEFDRNLFIQGSLNEVSLGGSSNAIFNKSYNKFMALEAVELEIGKFSVQ